jgi:N-methylhydantoinase B
MVTLGGLVLPDAETYEQLYPIRVARQEFRTDGGGAGRWRGGTGVDFEVEVMAEAEYSFRAEGLGRPTGIGVTGAGNGGASAVEFARADGSVRSPPAFSLAREGPGHLRISSAGGGGYGDPWSRPVTEVLRDVKDGVVSLAAARDAYGVVVAHDRRTVDETATAARRRELRAASAGTVPGTASAAAAIPAAGEASDR